MEEDRTHPWGDSSDHTDLATQPSVLMTVLDQNLNRQDVIMITSVTRALFSPQYLGCTSPGCRGCRDLCRRLGGRGSVSCRGSWGCSRCRGRAPRSWARATAGKSWPPPGRGWARSSGGTGCSDTERGTAGTVNSPEKQLEGFRTFIVLIDEDAQTSLPVGCKRCWEWWGCRARYPPRCTPACPGCSWGWGSSHQSRSCRSFLAGPGCWTLWGPRPLTFREFVILHLRDSGSWSRNEASLIRHKAASVIHTWASWSPGCCTWASRWRSASGSCCGWRMSRSGRPPGQR